MIPTCTGFPLFTPPTYALRTRIAWTTKAFWGSFQAYPAPSHPGSPSAPQAPALAARSHGGLTVGREEGERAAVFSTLGSNAAEQR